MPWLARLDLPMARPQDFTQFAVSRRHSSSFFFFLLFSFILTFISSSTMIYFMSDLCPVPDLIVRLVLLYFIHRSPPVLRSLDSLSFLSFFFSIIILIYIHFKSIPSPAFQLPVRSSIPIPYQHSSPTTTYTARRHHFSSH